MMKANTELNSSTGRKESSKVCYHPPPLTCSHTRASKAVETKCLSGLN